MVMLFSVIIIIIIIIIITISFIELNTFALENSFSLLEMSWKLRLSQ